MTKPDEVPTWAWMLALSVFDDLYDSNPDLEGNCENSIVEAYSRAMAKVAEEAKEECLEIMRAEREYGNDLVEAIERIENNEGVRQISGWNAPQED